MTTGYGGEKIINPLNRGNAGDLKENARERAVIMRLNAVIYNLDSGDSAVEHTHQSPYNARALNEDETRVAIG